MRAPSSSMCGRTVRSAWLAARLEHGARAAARSLWWRPSWVARKLSCARRIVSARIRMRIEMRSFLCGVAPLASRKRMIVGRLAWPGAPFVPGPPGRAPGNPIRLAFHQKTFIQARGPCKGTGKGQGYAAAGILALLSSTTSHGVHQSGRTLLGTCLKRTNGLSGMRYAPAPAAYCKEGSTARRGVGGEVTRQAPCRVCARAPSATVTLLV